MKNPRGVQKFIHVALQKMCHSIAENQYYFVRHSVVPGDSSRTWMDVLLEQLEAPVGPAVTLSELLTTNEALQRECVTPPLVEKFASMIVELGPQPRLVNFFSAICAVGLSGSYICFDYRFILNLCF